MGGERAVGAQAERLQLSPVDAGRPARAVPTVSEKAAAAAAWPLRLARWSSRVRPALSFNPARELAKDAARGGAFLCLPVLLAVGAAVYFALPGEPGPAVLASALVLLAVSAWLSRGRPVLSLVLVGSLVFTLGIAAAKLETRRAATPVVGSEVTTRVAGRLVRLEHQASGRIRLTIDIVATERPRLSYPPRRARLTARSVPPDLRPGDGVSGLVRLMSPSGPVRPGSYDFSFASYFDRLGAIGFFMSGPERVDLGVPRPVSSLPARWLESARGALANRIRSSIGGAEGEVAVAMIVGFRPGIPEEVNEWLRRSGLAHILAISGLHMALVAVTVMFMLRAGAALFPVFSSRVPVKKYAAAAALLFCTLYLFISGAEVAARRSYIMLGVMLAALIFDRAAITMRNVAIAALVIITLSPHEVIGPSFQMSFAATAALVAGYAAWNEWRRNRVMRRTPPPRRLAARAARYAAAFIAGLAVTSLIAGTATALYGVWHFQRATPLALPANLAAMPIVSLFVMPAGVLAMLAMPFGLDGLFLKGMGYAIGAVIAIAEWFSAHSPIDAVGLMPLPAMLTLTIALVILVVSTTRLRLLALPLIVAGTVLLMTRQLPDALVAEDARLVALRTADGRLAVNRNRPNGFTMKDWTRALKAETVVKPTLGTGLLQSPPASGAGFFCENGLCLARHGSGALIAHAENAAAARAACGVAALIVLDDAAADHSCSAPGTVLITKRDLARRGSAAVRFEERTRPDITFALEEPWRPWHAHRAFSRAARGLPPYRKRAKNAQNGSVPAAE